MRSPILSTCCLIVWAVLSVQTGFGQNRQIPGNHNGEPLSTFLADLDQQNDLAVFTYLPWLDSVMVKQTSTPSTLDQILAETFEGSTLNWFLNKEGQLFVWHGEPIRADLAPPAPLIRPRQSGSSLSEADELIRLANQLPSPIDGPQRKEQLTIGSGKSSGSAVVSGLVRDGATGTGIAGATVSVPDLKIGTYTDADG